MKQQTVVVPNRLGVHARPSARIARTAALFKSKITLATRNASGDAKSIVTVMTLAMQQGDFVTIEADGVDEDIALEAIASLFTQSFNEESIYD